jgi:hypothetical protein
MQNKTNNLFTPWKKPVNWLSSFKPKNPKLLDKGEQYKVVLMTRSMDKLKTNFSMKCNSLEMKLPEFNSSMKEAFISRHQFNEEMR